MGVLTYRRASGTNVRLLRFYHRYSARRLASLTRTSQQRVVGWADTSPAGHDLVSDGASAGSPMLNLNVDGYPALEIPTYAGGSALHYPSVRSTAQGATYVYYVKLKLSDEMTLASNAFARTTFGVAGVAQLSNFGNGGGTAAVPLVRSAWHSVIIAHSPSQGFIMVNGTVYRNAGGGDFSVSQNLNFFVAGSGYVRYAASYDRAATEDEALQLHQQLLASFPAVAVAARFATPLIQAVSPPQSETQKFFTLTKDAAYNVEDYDVGYDSGDTFVPLTSAALVGSAIQVPLPGAFYFPGEVGVRLRSTLARPESLLASNAGILGFVNYVRDSYFAQGSTYWSVQDVLISAGKATWQQDGGSLFQAIPGHTLRAGYQYKIQVTGTGTFHITKGEDYYGGQPNGDFTLSSGQTLEFTVDYGDVSHGIYLTFTGLAGSELTRVTWTIQ